MLVVHSTKHQSQELLCFRFYRRVMLVVSVSINQSVHIFISGVDCFKFWNMQNANIPSNATANDPFRNTR